MADEKKYTAREAAMAVLAKAEEMLVQSELVKAEKNRGYGRSSTGKHGTAKQGEKGVHEPPSKTSLSMNTRGAPGESVAGFHTALGNKDNAKFLHEKKLKELKDMPKPNLTKGENPDKDQDAKLGEAVEHLCEDHMLENKDAERKEGHKIVQKSECMKCMKSMNKNEAPPGEIKPKEHVEGEPVKPGARIEGQKAPQANPKEQAEGNNPPAGTVPGNGVMKLAFFMGHRHSKKKMKKGIALS